MTHNAEAPDVAVPDRYWDRINVTPSLTSVRFLSLRELLLLNRFVCKYFFVVKGFHKISTPFK